MYVVTHVDFFFRLDFQGVGDRQDSAAGAGDDGRRGQHETSWNMGLQPTINDILVSTMWGPQKAKLTQIT